MKGDVLAREWIARQADGGIRWRQGGDKYPATRREAIRMVCDAYGDGIHPAPWADLKKEGVRVVRVKVVEM